MRWLSPPESVPELRPRVRYSRPTFFRKPRRSLISLRMRWAISSCFGVSCSPSEPNQSAASRIEKSVTSLMLRPRIFTASASGFKRLPWQTSHSVVFWKRPSSSLIQELSVSL